MKLNFILTLFLSLFLLSIIQAQTISLNPDSGNVGELLEVSISGVGTQFQSGTSCSDGFNTSNIAFVQGSETIFLQDVDVINDELLIVDLFIPPTKPLGNYDLVIWSVGCEVSCEECFEVLNPVASITDITSNSADQGEELKVTISGENTIWGQASPCSINADNVIFSQGSSTIITPTNVVLLDTDTLCVFMDIPNNIDVGYYDVTIGTDQGCETTCNGCFQVLDPSNITGLDITSANQGEELKVTISGEDTYWTQASPCSIDAGTVFFSQGTSTIISPTNVVVLDEDTLCVFLNIPEDIDLGDYDVIVGTGDGCETTCDGCFEVLATDLELSTTEGGQGEDPQISFLSTSGSFAGCEYTLDNVFIQLGNEIIYASEIEIINDELIVSFEIPEDATLGNYDVIVGDGLEEECNFNCIGCYRVTAPPELVLPNETDGAQGAPLNLSFGLTDGTYDECVLTTTNVYLILGENIIYPTNVEVINNELYTSFDIPADAAIGDYDLIVGDGLEEYGCSFECIGCFTVSESVGIDPVFNASLSVYPNPFDNKIHIDAEMILNDVHLQLFDSMGKLVFENHRSQLQNETIELIDLPVGVYFFKILSSEGEAYKRIVRH